MSCSKTMKTLLTFYFSLSHNMRDLNVEFVFFIGPKCIGSLTVLSVSHNTHPHVYAYREIPTGSKGNIISLPRGKHSSKYCNTFPVAYSGLSLRVLFNVYFPWRVTSNFFTVLLHFYIFTAIARSPSQRKLAPLWTLSTSKERRKPSQLPFISISHGRWSCSHTD